MKTSAIPEKNLYIRYDTIFKAIQKQGFALSSDSSDVTEFTKKFNDYQKKNNCSLWDRKTIKSIATQDKLRMRHYNAQELCNFLGLHWSQIFTVSPPEKSETSAIDTKTLQIFTDRLIETAAKYEREIAELTEKNRKNEETIECITKDILYKSEQLKQANLKLRNANEEHFAFQRIVKDMGQKINTLDKSLDIKVGAKKALEEQNLEQAEYLLLKARSLDLDVLTSRKAEIIKTSLILGDLRYEAFDYRNALNFYLEAKDQGADRLDTLKKLGNCYLSLAQYKDALETYKRMQAIVSSSYSDSPEHVAESLYLLGKAFDRQGMYKQALDNYKSSLIEKYSYLDPFDLKIATNLHIIGNMELKQEMFTQSIKSYNKAQKIKDVAIEDESPLKATSKLGVGTSLCCLGEYQEAERFLGESVQYLEEHFGDSLQLAFAYNNLSRLYNSTDRHLQSASIVKKAIDISKNYLGERHDDIGRFYNSMAESYYKGQEYENAIQYYKSSIDIKTGIFGDSHEVVASSFLGIGNCYLQLSDTARAKNSFERSYEIYKNTLGEGSAKAQRAYKLLQSN